MGLVGVLQGLGFWAYRVQVLVWAFMAFDRSLGGADNENRVLGTLYCILVCRSPKE